MEVTPFATPHTCNDERLRPHEAHTTITHNREALHKCMEEMALGLTILENQEHFTSLKPCQEYLQ